MLVPARLLGQINQVIFTALPPSTPRKWKVGEIRSAWTEKYICRRLQKLSTLPTESGKIVPIFPYANYLIIQSYPYPLKKIITWRHAEEPSLRVLR
jgi:hypothetical protein